MLYNSADESFDPKYGVNAVVNFDGEVKKKYFQKAVKLKIIVYLFGILD